MRNDGLSRGSFTLPGEAGWEKLAKQLAEKWGADAIRDSDGTRLSDDLLRSGFDICSTLCLVRAEFPRWTSEDIRVECAWYPRKRTLVVINNGGEPVSTRVLDGEGGTVPVSVEAHGIAIMSR